MRIKINGEDVDGDKITIQTYEASTGMGLVVVIAGAILAVRWWLSW